MQQISRHTWVHTFLYSSRCRWMRHLLLCLTMLLFSFDELDYYYDVERYGFMPFTLLCTAGMLCKLGAIYILILFVIPRLLPQRRYTLFWSVTFFIIFFSLLLQHVAIELIYRSYGISVWRLQSGVSVGLYLLDFFGQFVMWFLVLMGLSVGRLLRFWTAERRRKQRMHVSQLQMEAESLKEQVTPELLLETLRQSGMLAQTDAQTASERLMLLSRLLRYQLYDCHRREVLLDSEVKFMHDYLKLLVQNGRCADYCLSVRGTTMGVFVPPLMFASLLSRLSGRKLALDFSIKDDTLTFSVEGTDGCPEESKVRRRLDRLYPQRYQLSVSLQGITLILQLRDYGKEVQQ